ncbi:hypothetical protein ACFLQ0_06690 [Nitrospinota bacterium]
MLRREDPQKTEDPTMEAILAMLRAALQNEMSHFKIFYRLVNDRPLSNDELSALKDAFQMLEVEMSELTLKSGKGIVTRTHKLYEIFEQAGKTTDHERRKEIAFNGLRKLHTLKRKIAQLNDPNSWSNFSMESVIHAMDKISDVFGMEKKEDRKELLYRMTEIFKIYERKMKE